MENLGNYFKYDVLDELAKNEKIYYSPSIGWDRINSKKIYEHRTEILRIIEKRVLDETYELTPYKVNLLIKNKDSKPRKTCIPTVKDRILIASIKRYLYNIFDGEKFNVSANSIVREIKELIDKDEKLYYKKMDLSAFFDNIDHKILLDKLSEKVNNHIVVDLIEKIIRNPQKCEETDEKENNVVGVPQGISIATLLANIYMHDFDLKYSSYENVIYFRYIDDIIIFAKDEKKIEEIFNQMKYDLERKLYLMINYNKLESGNAKESLEYLGYRFEKSIITVRNSSILKFQKKLENVFKNFSKIKNKDEVQVKKFIWLLNTKITGIIVENRKYGWLHYFSCINDKTLLKKLDLLIIKFIKRFKLEEYLDETCVKKFMKAYYEINNNANKSKYLLNLNIIENEEKKKFLKEICLIEDVDKFSEDELDYRYRYNLYRTLKSLEKDIDSISG